MKATERMRLVRNELQTIKPRARRRIELELRLRDLMTQQLKRETRNKRRHEPIKR